MSKSFKIFIYDDLRCKYSLCTSLSSLAILKKKLTGLRTRYDDDFYCLSYDPCTCKLQYFKYNGDNFFFKFPAIDFSKDGGKFYKAAVEFTKDYMRKDLDDSCSPLIFIYENFDRVIKFYNYMFALSIIEPSSIISLGGNL